MTETDRELSLQDEDRLPWLEAVEDDEEEGLSSSKILGFVLASLVALAVGVIDEVLEVPVQPLGNVQV